MNSFGKRQGGGRRAAARKRTPLLVVYTSVTHSHRAELIDLSSTGARLHTDCPPSNRAELYLSVQGRRLFGRVIWRRGQQFAMRFDEPLLDGEVDSLSLIAAEARGLSAEMKNALDVWMGGSPR